MSEIVSSSDPAAIHSPHSPDRKLTREEAAGIVERLSKRLETADLFQRLGAIRLLVPGRVVFTTSFGLEDQAVAHAIFYQRLGIDVATLDTGRLFPETHAVWAETERRYNTRIVPFSPARKDIERLVARQGSDGMRASVAARLDCCGVRKVEPLGRSLDGSTGWITGIRGDQSSDRAQLSAVSFDEDRRVIKTNPLFDWTRDATLEFVRAHQLPYNELHDRGFLSIGCAPCTRAVAPGEPERSGRWWWEQSAKKECGLHVGRPSQQAAH